MQNHDNFTSFSLKEKSTFFLVKSKLSTAKKSKTTTFSRGFSPKEKSTIFSGNQSWIFGQKINISNSVNHSKSHHFCLCGFLSLIIPAWRLQASSVCMTVRWASKLKQTTTWVIYPAALSLLPRPTASIASCPRHSQTCRADLLQRVARLKRAPTLLKRLPEAWTAAWNSFPSKPGKKNWGN